MDMFCCLSNFNQLPIKNKRLNIIWFTVLYLKGNSYMYSTENEIEIL